MKFLLYIILTILTLIGISVIRALINKKCLTPPRGFIGCTTEDFCYAKKLSEMVQYRTIAADVGGDNTQFDAYRKKLETLFPIFFSRIDDICIDGAYIWKIKGLGEEAPALILAHSDVVEAQGEWEYPPFAGVIHNNMVHGRGTLDNKGMLCATLCAMERLLKQGFVPNNDLYIVSTQNEESTSAGIIRCRDYFKQHNVFFKSILDEGGVITCGVMPGIENDIALIGLCEKGYIDLRFTAKSGGGHTASPGKGTPLARLAAFINYVETHRIFQTKILLTVREMFKAAAPHMGVPFRILLGNFWLYGTLLKFVLPAISPKIGAMLKTTIVFTRCEGGVANNVVPTMASITANIRNMPGESCEEVIGKLSRLAEKYDLETEVLFQKAASSETCAQSDAVKELFKIVEQVFPGTAAVPYMTIGATDCCRLDDLSGNIVRFNPLRATGEEIETIHAINERVGIAELGRAVEFFHEYIKLVCRQLRRAAIDNAVFL